MITIHIGIPAQGVRALAEALKNPEEITSLATLEAKEVAAKKYARKTKTGAPEEKEDTRKEK